MERDEPEIEFGRSEDYSSEKNQQFSHQQLVMISMRKCIESRAREMREGYYNIKSDRFGNTSRIYVEDTRKVFISCVNSVLMSMSCDMDENAKTKIPILIKEIEDKYKEFCEQEKNDWSNIPIKIRKTRLTQGIYFIEGKLNTNLLYYQDFIDAQVDIYDKIFKELTDLTSRKNFYEQEAYIA